MAKFVKVTEKPVDLRKDEYLIQEPNFLAEIKECNTKKPRNNLATTNYLREIIASIGRKYVGDTFNAFSDVNVSAYRGVPVNTPEDINKILITIFKTDYPKMFNQFVDYYIKHRPFGTKLIYFLGNHSDSGAFTQNGIDEIKSKEIESYLGIKNKKNSQEKSEDK